MIDTKSSALPLDKFRDITIGELALQQLAQTPEKEIIFFDNAAPVTVSSIVCEAKQLAVAMQRLGLLAGDVISFQLPSWRESVAIDLAASFLGLIVNPIIPIYRERELHFILKDANTRLLFIPQIYRSHNYPAMINTLRAQLPLLEHVVVVRGQPVSEDFLSYEKIMAANPAQFQFVAVDPDSVKTIMYTSGTTGAPKAVMHSHNSLARAIDNTIAAWQLTGNDVMLMPSPVTHITGFVNGIEMPFFTNVRSALMEQWNVEKAVSTIHETQATVCVSATPFLQELVDYAALHADPLPSLRLFACGGAAVPPELIRRVGTTFANCRGFRVYGSTEVPLVTVGFTAQEQSELAATTDGRIFNWQVKVVDEHGTEVNPGDDGELWVKGPAMMLGYQNEEQNRLSINSGFFQTGDIGHLTTDNAIVITDRKKDLIIRGGENLSAKEIEDVLHSHPSIHETAVVAMPHKRLGEGVCAFIIIESGSDCNVITVDGLQSLLQTAGLARQKWPEKIVIVEDFVRTASGKIRKDLLREQARISSS